MTFGSVPAVQAAAPKLNKTKETIQIGEKVKLKVKNTKKKIKWSSSNKKIATVSSKGIIKGKKKGSAKIIAKIGNKKLICKVKVTKKSQKSKEPLPGSHGSYEVLSKPYTVKLY